MALFLRFAGSLGLALLATLLIGLTESSAAPGFNWLNLVIIFAVSFSAALLSAPLGPLLGKSPTPKFRPRSAEHRERGKVKWFNVSKGYGFISRETGGDIFVHFRSIRDKERRALRDGQDVEFIAVDGEKGMQAEDVTLVTGK